MSDIGICQRCKRGIQLVACAAGCGRLVCPACDGSRCAACVEVQSNAKARGAAAESSTSKASDDEVKEGSKKGEGAAAATDSSSNSSSASSSASSSKPKSAADKPKVDRKLWHAAVVKVSCSKDDYNLAIVDTKGLASIEQHELMVLSEKNEIVVRCRQTTDEDDAGDYVQFDYQGFAKEKTLTAAAANASVTLTWLQPALYDLAIPYRRPEEDGWQKRLTKAPPASQENVKAAAHRGGDKKGATLAWHVLERWLVHTGNMGGDLWHIVAAMILDPSLKLLVIYNPQTKEDLEATRALTGLINSIGLANSTTASKWNDTIDNDKARAYGAIDVAKAAKGNPTLVGHTWASTSIVASAISRSTRDEVSKQLATGLCKGIPKESASLVTEKTLDWLARLEKKKEYLLVNMRAIDPKSGQNPQHCITEAIFKQIAHVVTYFARVGRRFTIVRVGRPELRFPKEFKWVADYQKDTIAVDIFREEEPDSKLHGLMKTDKRLQPYFWTQVVAHCALNEIKINFFGGRSGSMDIAAFVGGSSLRVACWDQVDVGDPHYSRLHLICPINSIIRYAANAGIDQGALAAWMSGIDLVPLLSHPERLPCVGTVDEYDKQKASFNALLFPWPDSDDGKEKSKPASEKTSGQTTSAAASSSSSSKPPPPKG